MLNIFNNVVGQIVWSSDWLYYHPNEQLYQGKEEMRDYTLFRCPLCVPSQRIMNFKNDKCPDDLVA